MADSGPRNLGFDPKQPPYQQTDLPDVTECRVVDYQTEERDINSDEGAYSSTWIVGTPQCKLMLSVDYPFAGWHELSRCYVRQGWNITSRRLERRSDADGGDFVEVLLSKPTGEHGYLLFSLFGANGEPLTPRPSHWRSLSVRLAENPVFRGLSKRQSSVMPAAMSFQVQ